VNPVRILLADDHRLVRAGLRKLLESIPDVEVVGECDDGVSVLSFALATKPDVVLMDISMPGLDGLAATAALISAQPAVRVLILSMHHDDEYVRQALRRGASGYLLKDSAPAELGVAISAVQRGETYLSPEVSQGVMTDYLERLRSDVPTGPLLTPRQRQVLKLVAEGMSTKAIARHLDLSVKTIDTHRSQLMKQLDIHEVTGLVRYAMRNGLILAGS
jgi:DNA-binding NarL/FixJ family response regulator